MFVIIEYRCAYCRFFNAARKQRPTAPRLPVRVDSPMIRRHRSDSQDNNVCKNIDFSSLTELSPDDAGLLHDDINSLYLFTSHYFC